MTENDQAYFERRAREERAFAATCTDEAAARAHLAIAQECERRALKLASFADDAAGPAVSQGQAPGFPLLRN